MPKRLTREESQARTREKLLNAAARLFVKHGFDGTSVDDITAAAGYTKGAFYANFESKEQALLALMDRHGEESRSIDQGLPLDNDATVRTAIRAHTLEHASHIDWLILGVEFKLAAARNPKLRAKYIATRRSLIAAASESLGRLYAKLGRQPVADPALICTALEIAVEGLALLRKIDSEAISDANAATIIDLLIDRILPAPGPGGKKQGNTRV